MSHRVLIDATAARFGGTAYAMIGLAEALARRPDVEHVGVVARTGSLVTTLLSPGTSVALLELPAARHGELARRVWWQASRLRRACRETGVTALLTASGMLPRTPEVPVVSFLMNPVAFASRSPSVLDRVRRRAIVRTSRGAAAVLVPSAYMQKLVRPYIRRSSVVVPLGVCSFAPAERSGTRLLCVADFYRHKRHDLLLRAWDGIPAGTRPPLDLIGSAAVDPAWGRRLAGEIARRPGVTHRHRLTHDELATAFHEARALVLPSLQESFCMPVAEAARSGVPAVVADHGALPDTAGPGAIIVRGDDAAAWTDALTQILGDDHLHRQLARAALAHASRFTYPAMAGAVVDVLAGAAG